jgi:hypothetical protein
MQSATRLLFTHIPAGTYAIGDPCHLLNDSEVVEITEPATPASLTRRLARGLELVVLDSPGADGWPYGGDGWLVDVQGGAYPIDSGLLTVMRLSDPVPLQIVEAAARCLVQLYRFEHETLVTRAGNILKVGGITITRDGGAPPS